MRRPLTVGWVPLAISDCSSETWSTWESKHQINLGKMYSWLSLPKEGCDFRAEPPILGV